MKFSVLLPTKNRLDLLQYAITSVIRQDYDDWEIIISDNCSEQDVAGYVRSLNDSRIKYYKTTAAIPVTDNWNEALEKSTGDYVIMLGDDDCLMPGYFQAALKLISAYESPDCIYTKAFQYAYPGVMPGFPEGFLQFSYASFFRGDEPFWLSEKVAQEQARASMDFRLTFNFNMQHSLVSRKLINSLASYGHFFQSPYPDYYASNVIFLKAKRILVYPVPIVTIGISPKSFGFYYFNDQENSGTVFLKNIPDAEVASRIKKVILSGSNMNTSWLLAMETIKRNFGDELELQVNYRRYRYWQLFQTYQKGSIVALRRVWNEMHFDEKVFFMIIEGLKRRPLGYLRNDIVSWLTAKANPYPEPDLKTKAVTYKNILDVFDNTNSENIK
jgi:glycosyltransferase involved in cell wall biosynthesis